MALPDIVSVSAWRCEAGAFERVTIPVSAEYPVTLSVNGRPFVIVACSGSDLTELAMGHLVAEGIVRTRADVGSVTVDEDARAIDVTVAGDEALERLMGIRTLVSACAGSDAAIDEVAPPERTAALRVRAAVIAASMKDFLGLSTAYRATHGVHSAAFYDTAGRIIRFYDEIGRHNAVDKLLGHTLAAGIDTTAVMLLSTGRFSSEIVHKAAAGRIPLLVTRAAPTSRALDLARAAGITLVTGVMRDTFYLHGDPAVIEP